MKNIKDRLEYLRGELENECISYEELTELQSLAKYIDPSDVQLLETAGVPEFKEDKTMKSYLLSSEEEVIAVITDPERILEAITDHYCATYASSEKEILFGDSVIKFTALIEMDDTTDDHEFTLTQIEIY